MNKNCFYSTPAELRDVADVLTFNEFCLEAAEVRRGADTIDALEDALAAKSVWLVSVARIDDQHPPRAYFATEEAAKQGMAILSARYDGKVYCLPFALHTDAEFAFHTHDEQDND